MQYIGRYTTLSSNVHLSDVSYVWAGLDLYKRTSSNRPGMEKNVYKNKYLAGNKEIRESIYASLEVYIEIALRESPDAVWAIDYIIMSCTISV